MFKKENPSLLECDPDCILGKLKFNPRVGGVFSLFGLFLIGRSFKV